MHGLTRDLPAWSISLVVNLSILLVLHAMVREVQRQDELTAITSVVDELDREEFQFSEATAVDQIGNQGDSQSMTPSMSVATALGQTEKPPEQKIEETLLPTPLPFREAPEMVFEAQLAAAQEVKGTTDDAQGGVEGTMDRITFEIASSLKERKTLVIWLFDASGSLEERRAAIANRFENVYSQLDKMGARDALYTAVASFGESSALMTPQPVQDPQALVEAVRKIKVDESGKENVFGAVRQVVDRWKAFHSHEGRWNKLVFIVTDEKGDDAEQHLEAVINQAKRFSFRCYAVGNAAVFGQEKDYVKYTFEDGYEVQRPVDRGPETAFPQALQLPFWGSGTEWRLRQMSASYGPYALTRLCSETGGMYLITDDTGGYNFDRSVMRDYTPDYRPVRMLEQEIRRHPAKAALVQVAGMSYVQSIPVPELRFLHVNDNILRSEITEAQKPVAEIEYRLIQMQQALSQAEDAARSLKEPRWRASFDLAMGRVLAMLVRLRGYNIMLANMKSTPKTFEKPENNQWILRPSSKIETGPVIRKAAEQAREYLKRVIDEHPGTPWAMLAEKELAQDLGWEWEESLRPIPGLSGRENATEEEVRLLLAEEEERRRRESGASKPRKLPNL